MRAVDRVRRARPRRPREEPVAEGDGESGDVHVSFNKEAMDGIRELMPAYGSQDEAHMLRVALSTMHTLRECLDNGVLRVLCRGRGEYMELKFDSHRPKGVALN